MVLTGGPHLLGLDSRRAEEALWHLSEVSEKKKHSQ